MTYQPVYLVGCSASNFAGSAHSRATGSLGRFRGWPSAVLSLLPPFAAPPLRGGWCPGWGGAPPGGLGLDTGEPPRSTLRKIQGGRKEAEGQTQAEQPHTRLREDSPASGGSPRSEEHTS